MTRTIKMFLPDIHLVAMFNHLEDAIVENDVDFNFVGGIVNKYQNEDKKRDKTNYISS